MCGIIGYKGFRKPKKVLLEGLQHMEYRGYDSSGVVLLGEKGLVRWRAVGSVQKLKDILPSYSFHTLGMGHIRWATHGKVLEKNAHPHQAGPLYLVHNGVIENTEELKEELKAELKNHGKVKLSSDTDSEVVAFYLLKMLHLSRGCLKQAVQKTIKKLKGEYAIIVLSAQHLGEMIAFKNGPSMAVGLGTNETFIASDFHAFASYTNKVVFLKDLQLVHVGSDNKVKCYDLKNQEVSLSPQILSQSQQLQKKEGKGKWQHLLLKEIHEQPSCVHRLLQTYIHQSEQKVHLPLKTQKKELAGASDIWSRIANHHLHITACGSSYYAALYGKYVIEKIAQVKVEVDISSEFRYRVPVLKKGTPVMVISQSGETADSLSVLRLARGWHCPVLSLCNVAQSAIDRESSAQLYMCAGVEKSVASTKAFLSTLVILFLMALRLGRQNGRLKSQKIKESVSSLLALPSLINKLLSDTTLFISTAKVLKNAQKMIYLGRRGAYPLALEGALKMKELSYRHAEGYPAGEMKHGPLALVDKDTAIVAIAPLSDIHNKMLTNLEEAKARGGVIIMIGTKGDTKGCALADHFLSLPVCSEDMGIILSTVVLQMLAYYTACLLGHNVDYPRNLAKSVTVE